MDRGDLRLETAEVEMGSLGEAHEVPGISEEQEGGAEFAVALYHYGSASSKQVNTVCSENSCYGFLYQA